MIKGVLLTVALSAAAPGMQAQERPSEHQKRRDQIQIMEGVLARAVSLGAAEVIRVMQSVDPGTTVLTGQARARGFVLEGYGVFFDVEIPALRQSVVWSMLAMQRDSQIANALEAMQRAFESMPEGPARQQGQQAFQSMRRLFGPPSVEGPQRVAQSPGTRSEVEAATVDVPLPPPITADPTTMYTAAVKRQLIDAMLDYSVPINLGLDEWLTVAARDGEGPMAPGDVYDATTIVLRVRGSDLAIYAADRSRRDEIRARVQVTVF